LYDGHEFVSARPTFVVVTVNHRLNVLATCVWRKFDAAYGRWGNAGQPDLVLALALGSGQHRANSAAIRRASGIFGPSGRGAKIRDAAGDATPRACSAARSP